MIAALSMTDGAALTRFFLILALVLLTLQVLVCCVVFQIHVVREREWIRQREREKKP